MYKLKDTLFNNFSINFRFEVQKSLLRIQSATHIKFQINYIRM